METGMICPGCDRMMYIGDRLEWDGVLTLAGTTTRQWRHKDCSPHTPTVAALIDDAMQAEELCGVDGCEACKGNSED